MEIHIQFPKTSLLLIKRPLETYLILIASILAS